MCWVWPHCPGPCLSPRSTHQRAAGWRTGPRFPTGLLAPLSSFLLSSLAAVGSLFGGAQGTGWTAGSAALLSLPLLSFLLGWGLVWSLFLPAPSSSIFPCCFLPLGPVLSPLFQLVAPPSARSPSLFLSPGLSRCLCLGTCPFHFHSCDDSTSLLLHLSSCLCLTVFPSQLVSAVPLCGAPSSPLCLSPLSLPAIQSPGCAVIPFCSPVLLPA